MSTSPKFCTSCGSPLAAGVRFCGQCGAGVQAAPAAPAPSGADGVPYPAPPPPPAAAAPASTPAPGVQPVGETIVGVLPVQRQKGILGMRFETFSLIVTPQRLIFAAVSSQMMKEAVAVARQEAKARGKGFLGQWAAQMGWLEVMQRQYYAMPVDAIAGRYPGSFVLHNAEIKRIHYRNTVDDESAQSTQELVLNATSGKYKFVLQGPTLKQAKNLLRQTLGGKA
jgi:hypothetical protein